jgi:hypothetical protein
MTRIERIRADRKEKREKAESLFGRMISGLGECRRNSIPPLIDADER